MHTLMLMMRVCLDVLYKRNVSYCNRLKKVSVNITVVYLFFAFLDFLFQENISRIFFNDW